MHTNMHVRMHLNSHAPCKMECFLSNVYAYHMHICRAIALTLKDTCAYSTYKYTSHRRRGLERGERDTRRGKGKRQTDSRLAKPTHIPSHRSGKIKPMHFFNSVPQGRAFTTKTPPFGQALSRRQIRPFDIEMVLLVLCGTIVLLMPCTKPPC